MPEDLRDRIDDALRRFLTLHTPKVRDIHADLAPVADVIDDVLLSGGKRLRPAFCYWGWRGAVDPADAAAEEAAVVAAAASLELLHAGALVHDDLMDRSDTRRGKPSVHRRFARLHADRGWRGDPDRFGGSAALLLGDLCLVWADAMFDGAGLRPAALTRARPLFDDMRTEVMAGQYLDLVGQVSGDVSLDAALRVARFKTAKYTVERPLHVGACIGGAPDALLAAYTAYGVPLGEAFQLRDDVLGVFGDPDHTGKPAGGDLIEGKHTALVALTLAASDEPGRAWLTSRLGADLGADDVQAVRSLMRDTGALDTVERLIEERTARALEALADVREPARSALVALATAATDRAR